VFARAVHLAEDAHDPPRLVTLRDLKAEYSRWSTDPTLAWKFLERSEEGFARRPGPEPFAAEVVLGPTIPEGDSA
jgi:hypothetical protein